MNSLLFSVIKYTCYMSTINKVLVRYSVGHSPPPAAFGTPDPTGTVAENLKPGTFYFREDGNILRILVVDYPIPPRPRTYTFVYKMASDKKEWTRILWYADEEFLNLVKQDASITKSMDHVMKYVTALKKSMKL